MNLGSWPNAVSFDPESGAAARIWEDALATAVGPAPTLLLVSGEAARYSGWSGRTAIALADALALTQPVILADLQFDQPELSGLIATKDAEGVADAILFGASLDRIALASEDHRFELVPAGGPVADPEALLRDPAWGRLIEAAKRRGVALLLYAPWRARGVEDLVPRVDGAVILGGTTDARLAAGYLPPELTIHGVLAPVTPRPTAAAPSTPVADAAATPVAVHAPPHRWLRVGLPLILLIGAAGAAAVLLQRDPGSDAVLTPPPAPPAAAPAPAGTPTGTPLPFAVAIEAHQQLRTAAERVDTLRASQPSMGFFLAPVLVDSVLYYRVLAGPVADSTAAAGLMARLIALGHKTGGSEWDIRNAPLAFDVGAFDTPESAEARADELAALNIPAYVLAVPYSSGQERYHVYSGAYAGPAEADVMRQVLADAGVSAHLVQRIGRSTS
jgi:hypothetical protein